MPKTINDLVNNCLLAYAKLAQLDPGDEEARSRTLGQYYDKQLIEALNASREMDPSGLSTFMLLRGLMDHFAANVKFSAREIFQDRAAFERRVAEIRVVFDLVEDPAVVSVISEFQDKLREMALYYRATEKEEFEAILQDKYNLAFLRRDALKSIDILEAFQFTQGQPSHKPLKLLSAVYEFWNVNSLLAGLRSQSVDGVSLCLIRDPEQVMASYFVFAVKNGETITILTDREEGPHPDFYRMSRRPDRTLERRAERHWFPYDLLDLDKHVKASGSHELFEKQRDQLVPYNLEAVKLTQIGALHAEELIWAGLLLELINDRYGRENRLLPSLTYTGEMVVSPEALVSKEGSLIRSGGYKPLRTRPLTREDVTAKTTRKQWRRKPEGHNEWMLDLYGPKVPEEVLNPVGNRGLQLLTEGQPIKNLGLKKEKRERLGEKLRSLSPVTFGSRKKLETDRLWAARKNQCEVVQKLAVADFEKNKTRVVEWCEKKFKTNRGLILEAVARESLKLPVASFASTKRGGFPTKDRLIIATRESLEECQDMDMISSDEGLLIGKYVWTFARKEEDRGRFTGWSCGINAGVRAALFYKISVTCPQALAVVLGVKVAQLPHWLQHYYTEEPYTGNSILDRCDPSDWVLDNPWRELNLNVYVALSKSAAQDNRKRFGLALLPPDPKKEPSGRYYSAEEILDKLSNGCELRTSDNSHIWLASIGGDPDNAKKVHLQTFESLRRSGKIIRIPRRKADSFWLGRWRKASKE